MGLPKLFPKVEDTAKAEDKDRLKNFLDSAAQPEPPAGSGAYTMQIIAGAEFHDVQLSPNADPNQSGGDNWTSDNKTTNDQSSALQQDRTAADDTKSDDN
jgi:hypothetical protein